MNHTDEPMLEAYIMEGGRGMCAPCLSSTEKEDIPLSIDRVFFLKLTFHNFSYNEIKKKKGDGEAGDVLLVGISFHEDKRIMGEE